MAGFPNRPNNPFPSPTGGGPGGGGGGTGYNQYNQQNNQYNTQFNQYNAQFNQINQTLKLVQQNIRTTVNSFSQVNNVRFTQIIREADRASRSVSGIGRAAGVALRNLKSISSMPFRMAGGMMNYRAMLAGVGAAAIPAFAGREAMKLESSRYDLARAMNMNPNAASSKGMFSGMLRSAARMPGIDVDSYLGSAVMGARQGINDPQKLALFASDVGKMSAVFDDIPIEELTTQLSRLMGVFDLSTDKVANLASAVNKLDMESTASARDILEISVRLSGMTSKLGFSVDQTVALAASLRQSGLPRETSGTAITQILGRMADGKFLQPFTRLASAGAKKEGEGENFGSRDFRKLMFGQGPGKTGQDAAKALRLVTVGLQEMQDEDAIRFLNRLSLDGQRVRGTMLQLGRVTNEWKDYQEKASEEMRTAASLMESFGLKGETAAAQLIQLKNSLKLAAGAAGTALLPVIKGANEAFTDLSLDFQKFVEDNPEKFESWGKSVSDSLQFIRIIGDDAKVAGKDVNLMWELISATAEEKFEQIKVVFARFGDWLEAMAPEIGGRVGESLAEGISKGMGGLGELIKGAGDMASKANFARRFVGTAIGDLAGGVMGGGLPGNIGNRLQAQDAMAAQDRAKRPPIDWNLGALGGPLPVLPRAQAARDLANGRIEERRGVRSNEKVSLRVAEAAARAGFDPSPEGIVRASGGATSGLISGLGGMLRDATPRVSRNSRVSTIRNVREMIGVPDDYNDRIKGFTSKLRDRGVFGKALADAGNPQDPRGQMAVLQSVKPLLSRIRYGGSGGESARTPLAPDSDRNRNIIAMAARSRGEGGGRSPLHSRSLGHINRRANESYHEMRDQMNAQFRGNRRAANDAWRGKYGSAAKAERAAAGARSESEKDKSKTIEGKADTAIDVLKQIASALGGAAALVPKFK